MLSLLESLEALERVFEEREPEIRAFVPEEDRFGRLRTEAKMLAERYPDHEKRPALFGQLVGIKDIFHVTGFPTRAGSRLPPEVLAGEEAESVRVLKKAGALILGKTVTTEFAYFAPGPTKNPHNLEHTPGGSSSGSAAAVAAGLCPLALGTQTIGSITRPAAFCGVVGYKPSHDRISRAGVIPLSPSLDHIGPIARNLRLAEAAAGLLCQDWRTNHSSHRPVLGVPEGPYLERATGVGLAHFRDVLVILEKAGFEVYRVPAMEDFQAIEARHNLIVLAEAARVHRLWYDRFAKLYHPKTVELVERGKTIDDDALADALPGRLTLRKQLMDAMDARRIDVWLSPAAPGPAPRGHDSTGDPVMNMPWTHSGLPTITISSGQSSDGLPMGLQMAARWYEDEKLFRFSEQLNHALAATGRIEGASPRAEAADQNLG